MENIPDSQNPNLENTNEEITKLRERRLGLLAMMNEANDLEINRALTDDDTLRQKTNQETGEPLAFLAELPKVIARIEARLAALEKTEEADPDIHIEAA